MENKDLLNTLDILKKHITIVLDLSCPVPVSIKMNVLGNDKDFNTILEWFLKK